MPCGGPSQEFAFKRGDEIAEELLKVMREKHHIAHPFPEGVSAGFPGGFGQQLCKEWESLEKTFRETVRQMVWNTDCQF